MNTDVIQSARTDATPSLNMSPDQTPAANQRPTPQPLTLKRRIKNFGKMGLRKLFELGQRRGFDILPHHFYSEIPNIRELRNSGEWKMARSMVGVPGAETETQFDFLETCCHQTSVTSQPDRNIYQEACVANGVPGYSQIDAEFLYRFIQTVRPKRIVQIGCGVSTAVVIRAAQDVQDYEPEIICVEPYPTEFLKKSAQAGKITLIAEKAQTVALKTLTDLGDSGFLFVDSTHAVKPGSEVNRLVFEVLPRLEPGSWVHFHDIYFPYDYQRGLLEEELFFSNESALLHAFLIDNEKYTIRVSLSMLHYSDPERLQRSLPNYIPARNNEGLRSSEGHFPGALYLQTTERQSNAD